MENPIALSTECFFGGPFNAKEDWSTLEQTAGNWVCGGACRYDRQNPDGTWVCGGASPTSRQNPDGTWVCGGTCPYSRRNPAPGLGLCYQVNKNANEDFKYSFIIADGSDKTSWLAPQEWITDNKYNFTIQYSPEQKNYIVTEGYFKGGVIEGYEQNGKVIIATKTVFVSNLRGAELNFDGDISLMTNGWLRLNHRKGDNTWALGLKIQDYDELVYDTWNCTTEFEPEDDRFTFSNSAVRMVINVTETDCFINLFTVDDQSITVGMWPTAREDAGKIRRGIEEYCKYTSAPVISQTDTVANFIEATGPEESDFSPSRETISDPEMATVFEDTQFYVSKEKSGNDVYYKGESDHVMSEYLTQIYVEMISKPDPNKSTDIGNILFFLNYSGKIGQDALDIMKRYGGETVEARFFFLMGSPIYIRLA